MLTHLSVAELGDTVAAASAGRMLSQLGARVTRFGRSRGPGLETQRDRLLGVLGAGKREVVVDDPWSDDVFAAAAKADVTVADMSSIIGLDEPDAVSHYRAAVDRTNRRVWVSISPFGLTGPMSRCRGADLILTAAGGIAQYMRTSDGRPMKPAGFSATVPAGQYAALAALHGVLEHRERGAPVHLDLSIQDTIIATGVFLEISHVSFACSQGRPSASYAAPVGLIRCADGLVWITVLEEHHWEGCVRAIGGPAWAKTIGGSEDRHARSTEIRVHLDEWAHALSAADCAARLQEHGVPATEVNSPGDLLNHPGRDVSAAFFLAGERAGERIPGVPFRLPGKKARSGAPRGRVLDVTAVLVGPLATAWLAAMGIDVLKVEDPKRTDVYRRVGPFAGGVPDLEAGAYFSFVNYSKRSHAVELDTDEGRTRLDALVAGADVVVTNVTRRRAERLGLEPTSLPDGPSLVFCSGFDRSTEHSGYRAYGLNIQAAGGAVRLSSDRAGVPRNFGTSWADPLASVWIAALAAAQLVAPPGAQAHAEVSMVEVIAWQFPEYFSDFSLGGPERSADESRLDHAAPHALFRCAGDDRWLAIAVEGDLEWRRLVEALGSPPTLAEPRFAAHADRLAAQDELETVLGGVLATRDRDEAFDLLQAVGVAAAPVLGAPELARHPHLLERGILQRVTHPVWGSRLLCGLPWQVIGEGPVAIAPPPLLGEHTSDDPGEWWR